MGNRVSRMISAVLLIACASAPLSAATWSLSANMCQYDTDYIDDFIPSDNVVTDNALFNRPRVIHCAIPTTDAPDLAATATSSAFATVIDSNTSSGVENGSVRIRVCRRARTFVDSDCGDFSNTSDVGTGFQTLGLAPTSLDRLREYPLDLDYKTLQVSMASSTQILGYSITW